MLVLEGALAEGPSRRWAASEVGVIVPRQNGKGGILEARELAGLYLFGEELILHSAHEFKTAAEAFRRLLSLIENSPDLDRRVARVRTSHGEEGIELKTGQRLRFVARSTGSGRGFSGDCVILDEAYNLPPAAIAALLPTLAARPNPQLWYTSSAPLPRQESDTLRRLCRRGRAKETSKLAYFEWSAAPGAQPDDRKAWAAANPALGIRISEEFIRTELGALDSSDFTRERLGQYPEEVDLADPVLDEADWKACWNPVSRVLDPVVLAFEVSLDRKWSVIAAAGVSDQGGTHVEVIDNRRGTGWVVDRLLELRDSHHPSAVLCNPAGPAGALLVECERKGIEVGIGEKDKLRGLTGREYAQACGSALDAITQHQWRHLDQAVLNTAVTGAAKRTVGDAMVFDRRGSVDISPLVAVTVAAWAAARPVEEPKKVEPFFFVT